MISIFISLSAFAMLIIIFGPKLFLILFQPGKNVQWLTTQHMRSNINGLGSVSGVKSNNYKEGKQQDESKEGKGRALAV